MAKVRPPRGFRDFPPDLMLLRKKLFSRLEEVFQRYGFDPIDTPALEYWETLAGKYGEEAESRLIWRFQDPWSGRWYALRYDLTVPLARFVASNPGIQMPFKRYHIGPVWRHEEPQRGRYREFYQCDADIVGSPYPEADAEILNLLLDALDALGLGKVQVKVNDRRILAGVFEEELGLKDPVKVYRAIDKLDKIGFDGVRAELGKLGLPEATVERIMEIIEWRGEPFQALEEVEKRYGGNRRVSEGVAHLRRVFELADDERLVFDMSLVRGLDYYTGPIFEAVPIEVRMGSVAGGGRYDGLIGMFLGRDIPATGVSIGIERIIDAGLELGIYSLDVKTVTQVQVIVLDHSVYDYAWRVARRLRSEGLRVRIDLARVSGQVQRRKASKLGIPILVYVGPREAESGTVVVYDSRSGERREVSLDAAGSTISKMLG